MITAALLSVLATLAVAAPAPAPVGPVKLGLTAIHQPLQIPKKGDVRHRPSPQNGVAPLTNWGRDVRYTTTLTIGTPPQPVELQIDTGSSLLWTMDGSTHQTEGWWDTNPDWFFNSKASSSFKYELDLNGNPQNASIVYLKGSTDGLLGKDVITIGGQTITDQGFLAADKWSDDMTPKLNSNVTGILGLGFPRDGEAEPIWHRLAQNWKEKRFGVFLDRISKDPEEIAHALGNATLVTGGGELTLGGIDEDRIDGPITYAPRVGGNRNYTTHWAVALDSFNIGGKPNSVVPPKIPAIFDTGATIIVGPRDAVAEYYKSVEGATPNILANLVGGMDIYDIPCNTTQDLSFTIGGTEFPVDNSDLFFIHQGKAAEAEGNIGCTGAIAGADLDFWLLGDTFLKNVYSVYELDTNRVGFAKLKE